MTCREYIRRTIGFRRDVSAQATVEYVVVVPVVLLMFFAALQTALIAQAAQLANYAAFSAARSYATSYSLFKHESGSADDAHDQASDRAKKAATLIMAPISHAQFGEGLEVFNAVRSVVSGLPAIVADAAALLEGYLVASLYRIQDFEITRPEGGDTSSTASIYCNFEYWMPISLPGLAEIWDYLDRAGRGGEQQFQDRMINYFGIEFPILGSGGINETVNEALDILGDLEQWIPGIASIRIQLENALIGISDIGLLGAPYNVHILASARVGFEPWNGQPIVGPDEADCEAEVDEETAECIEQYQEAQQEVEAMKTEMEEICNQVPAARQEEQDKVIAYNLCIQDPDNDCGTELSEYQAARTERINKEEECEEKTDEYEAAREELEDSDALEDCL